MSCIPTIEFYDLGLGADGRFGYGGLSLFWSEPGRYPFLVLRDGELAGFVLIKRSSEISGDEAVWDMDEFFALRKYRRRGLGTVIAHDVWRRFPGLWEVRVMDCNAAALRFWTCAISGFTGDAVRPVGFEKNGGGQAAFFESRDVS